MKGGNVRMAGRGCSAEGAGRGAVDGGEQIGMTDAGTGCGAHENFEALKLGNQVCFPLYACSKELVRQYGPYLKDLNLTYTQYLVMMVLWEREQVSSRELAACLHLDYGTLTPVLKRLEEAGDLTRERAAEDERLLTLKLTEKGRNLRESAVSIPPAMAECMGLTMEEFGVLYALTYKALKNMEGKRE